MMFKTGDWVVVNKDKLLSVYTKIRIHHLGWIKELPTKVQIREHSENGKYHGFIDACCYALVGCTKWVPEECLSYKIQNVAQEGVIDV